MRLTRALLFALLLSGSALAQERAVVVATCGTAPGTWAAGENRPLTQNTNGQVCISGAASAPVGADYIVGTANATLTNEIVAHANGVTLIGHDFAGMRTDLGLSALATTVPGAGVTTSLAAASAEAYDATGWNGDNGIAEKNDVRDKFEAIAFSGAVVRKNAAQVGANYTTSTAVTWDVEDLDTNAWHDTGSNTTRLTVPSGVTFVRVLCTIAMSNGTATTPNFQILIRKNGTTSVAVMQLASPGTGPFLQVISGPLAVVATDYFECMFAYTVDTSIDISTSSFFAIEAIF